MKKKKCNRATPCSACITRKTPDECTYATTPEERDAIAAAEFIAELRNTRNKLQSQLAKKFSTGYHPVGGTDAGFRAYEEEEEERLEAVYGVLRTGSGDVVREIVGRLRAGEGVGSGGLSNLLGGLELGRVS